MRQYLLIAKGDHEVWRAMSEEENEQLEAGFRRWIDDLRARDLWVRGEAVSERSSRISRDAEDQIQVAEPARDNEAVTGFFLFRAEGMQEAIDVARGCPALLHDSLDLHELESEG